MSAALRTAAAWIGGAAFLVALTFVLGGYGLDIYRKLLLTATLALSYNFMFGVAGQIALSHYTFYGIGAYSVTILMTKFGVSLPLAALATIGISAVVALFVAFPANRLEGFFLALATLALAQLFVLALVQGGEFTGGADGIFGFAAPEIFGISLSGTNYVIALIGLFLGTLALLQALEHSYFGRACRAIKDNPRAAAAMGINVARTNIIVFTLTSTMAAVAGIFYAFADKLVTPPVFGLEPMFLLVFMVIVGGTGRHAGAIVGATVLFLLPEFLGDVVGHRYVLIYGFLVVLALMFQPNGLIGVYDGLRRRPGRRA